MLRIHELFFDEWNEAHIAQHGVIPEEVEEVCKNRSIVSRTRQERLRVIGQTEHGRYLTVILAPRGKGVYYPITARDATQAERRLYQRKK
jgi:uncharacterized protein